MIAVWPAALPQRMRWDGFDARPLPGTVSFAPERGAPIDRPAVSAVTLQVTGSFPNLTLAQQATFETFFDATLARGALTFAWRDPRSELAWAWKFRTGDGGFRYTPRGPALADLTVDLFRLPGPPWWQSYATASGALRLPHVVADYANGVFGIDLVKVAAADVADVAGTFDLYTTATGGAVTEELAHAVLAGDIPATAPTGVAKIVGYSA